MLWKYGNSLPDYKQLQSYQTKALTRVYSSNENILGEFAEEKRIFVPYEAIPDLLIKAFVVTEDKNFFNHDGLDFQGISRAVVDNIINLIKGNRLVGASTITQQVAKNFLLSNEVSVDRKIKEALLALRIERTLSKEKILELYLNEIFLGFRSYGIVVAANNYFDKSLEDLNLSEIAYLAGLPKGPNNYHPIKNPKSAKNRRNYVLRRLLEEGVIHSRDYNKSIIEEIKIPENKYNLNFTAEYFTEDVRKILLNNYGQETLYNSGFYIFTTLDEELQKYAEDSLNLGLEEYDRRQGWRGPIKKIESKNFDNWINFIPNNSLRKNTFFALVREINDKEILIFTSNGNEGVLDLKESSWILELDNNSSKINISHYKNKYISVGDVLLVKALNKKKKSYLIYQKPEVNGALVAIEPHTGKILALVGGGNYKESKFNRATQAMRQAGSAFKPFVYLAALEQGMTPSSMILDSPLVIDQGPGLEEWIPKNYSGKYYGLSTLRTGLEKSRNVMTVRLANTIGMDKIVEVANRFNIGKYPEQLATALGAGETSLLNLTIAYASFVNGGKLLKPEFIETIHDRNGKIIFSRDDTICKICNLKNIENEIFDQKKVFPRVISEENAFQIAWLLNGVVKSGTGKSLNKISNFIGGKTGTTNDNKDAWFIGYSSKLIVGVYVGYDQPKSLGKNETGGKVSAPIWGEFMKKAILKYKDEPILMPTNIDMVKIDAETGLLPSINSSQIIFEAFISGTAPTKFDVKPNKKDQLDDLDGQIY
tara:strand:+ start:16602 stop:18899 length:2298 start_codon:yes stop_codon:yes gene_type:complete